MVIEKKKSWREIDRQRDKSRRPRKKKQELSNLERALENPRVKDRYLKEAEKLFMGVKGQPQHSKDLRAIHKSYGRSNFQSVAKHYVETYGMPNDWGTLLLFLDIRDNPELVCKAIQVLCKIVGGKGPVEKKGLKSKLKVLSLIARDPQIRETAETQLAGFS